jgi:hypothetical protein
MYLFLYFSRQLLRIDAINKVSLRQAKPPRDDLIIHAQMHYQLFKITVAEFFVRTDINVPLT